MRKTFLRSLVAFIALALAIIPIRAMAEDSNSTKTLTLDVAIDGSTLALNNNDPANPAVKGTTFTVTGKIFPGGTIPDGVTPFDPNQPGSIGTWICSGVFVADAADIFGGKAKIAFHTNQIFMFSDDRNALFTEGLEGSVGTTTHRVVVGSTGAFEGLVGQERQETIGLNLNGKGLFDIHFTFALRENDFR